jgi:hypothetical protein
VHKKHSPLLTHEETNPVKHLGVYSEELALLFFKLRPLLRSTTAEKELATQGVCHVEGCV